MKHKQCLGNSGLLKCDAASLRDWFPIFRKNSVPYNSRTCGPGRRLF